MFMLFALLKVGGILGGLLVVGLFMLPTATTLQVVGGGLAGLVGLPLLVRSPLLGGALIAAGIALFSGGVILRAHVDAEEAKTIQEDARRASRAMELHLPYDDKP